LQFPSGPSLLNCYFPVPGAVQARHAQPEQHPKSPVETIHKHSLASDSKRNLNILPVRIHLVSKKLTLDMVLTEMNLYHGIIKFIRLLVLTKIINLDKTVCNNKIIFWIFTRDIFIDMKSVSTLKNQLCTS